LDRVIGQRQTERPRAIFPRAVLLSALALSLVPQSLRAAGDVNSARLRTADSEPHNWFTLGRDQNQTYYSTLAKNDADNVSQLGFAWAYDLGTARGQEATPLVIDGAMYTSGTWGYVYVNQRLLGGMPKDAQDVLITSPSE
jgi:quinohemoprotein ethanol dehydrogenase